MKRRICDASLKSQPVHKQPKRADGTDKVTIVRMVERIDARVITPMLVNPVFQTSLEYPTHLPISDEIDASNVIGLLHPSIKRRDKNVIKELNEITKWAFQMQMQTEMMYQIFAI